MYKRPNLELSIPETSKLQKSQTFLLNKPPPYIKNKPLRNFLFK